MGDPTGVAFAAGIITIPDTSYTLGHSGTGSLTGLDTFTPFKALRPASFRTGLRPDPRGDGRQLGYPDLMVFPGVRLGAAPVRGVASLTGCRKLRLAHMIGSVSGG